MPVRAGIRLTVACALLLGSCEALTAEMGADTPCREFLQAPRDEQDAAVARVADEVGAEDAVTPLGRPNIDYLCSQDQDMTLGEAVRQTG